MLTWLPLIATAASSQSKAHEYAMSTDHKSDPKNVQAWFKYGCEISTSFALLDGKLDDCLARAFACRFPPSCREKVAAAFIAGLQADRKWAIPPHPDFNIKPCGIALTSMNSQGVFKRFIDSDAYWVGMWREGGKIGSEFFGVGLMSDTEAQGLAEATVRKEMTAVDPRKRILARARRKWIMTPPIQDRHCVEVGCFNYASLTGECRYNWMRCIDHGGGVRCELCECLAVVELHGHCYCNIHSETCYAEVEE